MRITNTLMMDMFRRDMQKASQDLLSSQVKMATQKRINRISDDASTAGVVQEAVIESSATAQYVRNIDRSEPYMNLTDSALGQIEELLSRARELMISQANSATTTPATREAVAVELISIRSQLVTIANSRMGARYIFAGTLDNAPPFTATSVTGTAGGANAGAATVTAEVIDETLLTGDDYRIVFTAPGVYDVLNVTSGVPVATNQAYVSGSDIVFEGVRAIIADGPGPPPPPVEPQVGDTFDVAYHAPGQYLGNSNDLEIEYERGNYSPISLTGDRVFQGAGLAAGVNLFATINDAIDALRADDIVAIDTSLDRFDAASKQISEHRALVGAWENLFDTARTRQHKQLTDLDVLRSRLEDVDLADVATEYTQKETAMQAILSIGSRVARLSLLDFLG